MIKQSIFPYYTDTLAVEDGVNILNIEGASMMHFVDVKGDHTKMLEASRIDALVIVVCVRGEVSFTLHTSNYTLNANDFFISSASVLQFRSVADSEFYMLAFSPDFLMSANADVRFIARMVSEFRTNVYKTTLAEREAQGVCRLFKSIQESYNTKRKGEYMELSLRHVYCAMIYRIADAILDSEVLPMVGVKDRSSEYFETLMRLLAENYREQRNVEFYADRMHISSKHLSRVIRNFTGKSVHQWIDEFVALEIKNMLRHSKLSIQQISHTLNFPNPSFMGQYFKRITGQTPGEYKKG